LANLLKIVEYESKPIQKIKRFLSKFILFFEFILRVELLKEFGVVFKKFKPNQFSETILTLIDNISINLEIDFESKRFFTLDPIIRQGYFDFASFLQNKCFPSEILIKVSIELPNEIFS
jgi:hypothetical protein